jgi:multiple sugar transport system permease protein
MTMSVRLSSARPMSRAARGRRRRSSWTFYGFISPWLLGVAALTLFPLGYAVYLSFTDWDGLSPIKPWVGLANYREVFSSGDTWDALYRTGLLMVIVVPATIVGSLLLAMMLNEKFRGRTLLRTLIYIPAIVPPVAATLIWKLIFDKNNGAANRLLALFGINAVSWLTGSKAFIAVVVVMLWALGAGIIINLAALQVVDVEQLDAARVDGAGRWATFRHVTLPAISPVLLFQTVLTLIATLQTFIPAVLLAPIGTSSGGASTVVTGVPAANHFYMVDVYSQYFAFSRYGYGSAMLVIFFFFILILTGFIFKIAGRRVYYAVDPTESGGGR